MLELMAGVTGFSRWGFWPGGAVSLIVVVAGVVKKRVFRQACCR